MCQASGTRLLNVLAQYAGHRQGARAGCAGCVGGALGVKIWFMEGLAARCRLGICVDPSTSEAAKQRAWQ